jgi:hypothetical protein
MAKPQSYFMQGFSEAYLADLGRVVAAWAHVEFHFDLLFLSLVVMRGKSSGSMSDPRVKQMGDRFKDKLAAFRDRIAELDLPDGTRKNIESTLNKLETLRNKRDWVAHSQWQPDLIIGQVGQTTATALFKSWKNAKPPEFFFSVPQEELKKIFRRISGLFSDLLDLSLDPQLRAQQPRRS